MIDQIDNNKPVQDNFGNGQPPTFAGHMSESLIAVMWRGRWLILLAVAAALVTGFIYISKATPIYTSTSRIYVEQTGPKIISETEEGVMTRSKNYLYTQAEMIKSTPILAAILDDPAVGRLNTFTNVDNKIAYLKKNIQADVGKKDDIISVSLDSPWPAEAAQIVNQIVDSYITYNSTRKRSTSAEVLKILQSEKVKRDRELADKRKALLDFKLANESLALESSKGNVITERLARLSDALTQAQFDSINAKTNYETTKAMLTDQEKIEQFINVQRAKGTFAAFSNQQMQFKNEIDALEKQLSDLMITLTDKATSVKALQDKIATKKSRLTELENEQQNQFIQLQLDTANQEYLAAQEKEQQIREFYEQQRQETIDLNAQLARYEMLTSDFEQTKKLVDILDDRIKEINIVEDVGALNISILEVARPAGGPSKPQKARVMAIALVLGFMLGGGVALLRDWLDQTLRSAEEISAILGVPVLGVVPSMSKKQTLVERGQKVYLDSHSVAAEAYRTIRTAVFFGAPKDEAKTVLVTSPAPVDGKTTLVSNLAISMAQAGQKTLILDADFRKPMQHVVFETNHQDKGLSSLLAGVTTLEESIQATKIEGLELLPCGPNVPNPSELLNSETFARTLEQLSDRYDRVIIDAPPVIPVTDAQILAA
ncbi:MAG: polysaccharide biosynthesis tyrosine autokinase, partial [Dehalococcoidia bacterium]|nr:polysaccharide biosynthesis tyrosine autokinase [Dehalococcoidia bacterium]